MAFTNEYSSNGQYQPLIMTRQDTVPPVETIFASQSLKPVDLIDDEEPTETDRGLCHMKAVIFLVLWYLFSFSNLFMNKYTLDTLKVDATLLGVVQMCSCISGGFLQMYFPCGMYKQPAREGKPPRFLKNMFILGTLRFTTVVLGLVALKFVAMSFTETVKSSAPIFTVFISRLLIGEQTGLYVNLSLIPVMSGLALCSATELSFNLIGFLAALSTNICECSQNVFSKMLRSDERYQYTPAELQFFSSSASVFVEMPAACLLMDFSKVQHNLDRTILIGLLFNGMFFHFQTITEYVLIGYISPVTHSVANTVKRALLIWMSVIIFGNKVTFLSGLGTTVVLIGVLLYNQARAFDQARIEHRRQLIDAQQSEQEDRLTNLDKNTHLAS